MNGDDIIEAVPPGGRPYGLYRAEVYAGVARGVGKRVRLLHMRNVEPGWCVKDGQRVWGHEPTPGEVVQYASEVRIETWATDDGKRYDWIVYGSHRDPRIAIYNGEGLVLNVVRADPRFAEHVVREFGLGARVLWDALDPTQPGDRLRVAAQVAA